MSWVWVVVAVAVFLVAAFIVERRNEADRKFIIDELTRLADLIDSETTPAPAHPQRRGRNTPSDSSRGSVSDDSYQRNARNARNSGARSTNRRR